MNAAPVGQAQKPLNDGDRALRVCFVCTGNTCRSPMAAAVANFYGKDPKNAPKIEAFSAGLYAAEGDPIAGNAVLALEEAGIEPVTGKDYHKHTAHTLTEAEAENYDRIIGLTGTHAMELLLRFPALAGKITCLPVAVADPFGGDLAVYRAALSQIISAVKECLFGGMGS